MSKKVNLIARHNMPEREIKEGEPFSVDERDAEFLVSHGFAQPSAPKKAKSTPAKPKTKPAGAVDQKAKPQASSTTAPGETDETSAKNESSPPAPAPASAAKD